jgi:hypothetical protein
MKNLCLVLVLLLTGCSAIPLAPPEEDQTAKEFRTLSNSGVIYIFRDQVFVGSAVATTLFVDGKLLGGINDHNFRTLEVAPGQHQLTATSNTGVVASLPIEAKAGEFYFVRATSWPRLMLVTPEEGKTQVRKCKLEKANY